MQAKKGRDERGKRRMNARKDGMSDGKDEWEMMISSL